jgi:general secretion pathway protein A
MADTPFSISPNPNTLYLTPRLKAVLHKVRFTVDKRQGLTAILGDNGLGKSSILRFLHSEYLARENVVTTLIPTPVFSSDFAMLKSICQDFDLPARRGMTDQLEEFQSFLLEQYQAKKNIVLFIDEAQKLTNKMLEMVRAILNFETHTHKLVQIVLSGQLELRNRLLSEAHKALRSRLSAPSLLDALTPQETADMLEYRCKAAEIANPFTSGAVERIYELTNGVPRDVLLLCALAYELMIQSKEIVVDDDLIDSASDESSLVKGASG